MVNENDKRTFSRIEIPGAVIIFKRRNKLGLLERFSRPMQLLNITKSGICFKSEKKFNYGDHISVEINIPGEKHIIVEGDVKWLHEDLPDNMCLVGAQFVAFGKGRQYNSLSSLERLRTIHEKYGNYQA